ncbi:MAG TPA: LytTR family DNA-binding domain-containing protein [Gemmatimonas sp.]|nr:LytTR family DNA-binding domain-containing protein [Gemmatimonas sp.]
MHHSMGTTPVACATDAMTLKVLIVDDEQNARLLLRRMLHSHPRMQVIEEAQNGQEALVAILRRSPDVVFLDIQMPEMDGFQLLDALHRSSAEAPLPAIVFVTAYEQYAVRAFEVRALDYLLKPVDEDRLAATVSSLEQRLGPDVSRRDAIAVEESARLVALLRDMRTRSQYARRLPVRVDADRIVLQPVEDLTWVEADRKFVRLHTARQTVAIRDQISRLEAVLDPTEFMRVSRSALVRIGAIQEIQTWFGGEYILVLKGGARVHTTRSYRDRVRALTGNAE